MVSTLILCYHITINFVCGLASKSSLRKNSPVTENILHDSHMQTTPASSKFWQSWMPIPRWGQSISRVSEPVQATSSKRMGSKPSPKLAPNVAFIATYSKSTVSMFNSRLIESALAGKLESMTRKNYVWNTERQIEANWTGEWDHSHYYTQHWLCHVHVTV